MVQSMMWNATCNMLATVQDGRLIVYTHPAVVFVDKELLHK